VAGPFLHLIDLRKTFRDAGHAEVSALAGIHLTVEAGELLAVVGPSGGGKTTLLRLIAGLETPDSGTITLAGRDLAGVPPVARDVAMVFQNLALYPHLSAEKNLAFGLRLRRVPPAEIRERVRKMAERLGLTGCLHRRPGELSGGQRQRVALGRALIRRPAVLLLDEPFAQLDAPLRRELRAELRRLHVEWRCTTLLVTHDPGEALALGDRVAVLCAGRVTQLAAPAELQARPANDFVREFLDLRAL
jgi:ABC-type sugar transport system ATPase subunit